MTLPEVSFKQLSELSERVARRYFLARKIAQFNTDNLLSKQVEQTSNLTCQIYLTKVISAFEALNERERKIINNEFFFQGYDGWWKSIYSTSSFYRYKKQAMLRFLEVFYRV